jgi:hypothetical protein
MPIKKTHATSSDCDQNDHRGTGRRLAGYTLAGAMLAGGVAYDAEGLRLWINLKESENREAVHFIVPHRDDLSVPWYYPLRIETLSTAGADLVEYFLRPRST